MMGTCIPKRFTGLILLEVVRKDFLILQFPAVAVKWWRYLGEKDQRDGRCWY